jgi:small redox-active disulfide protein 2
MNVKVLGPGCANCKKLYAEVEKAVAHAGLPITLEKIERIDEILKLGVMMTPALIIDGEVKCSGRVALVPEIVSWIMTAAVKSE